MSALPELHRPLILATVAAAMALVALAPAAPTVAHQGDTAQSSPVQSPPVTDALSPESDHGPAGHVELIELAADSTLHGGEAGSHLQLESHGKTFFDYNGDGHKDFFVSYATRAFNPELREDHLEIVFGRAEWPEHAAVSSLPDRMTLELPDPDPGDPEYELFTVKDMNGDHKEDLVIKTTETRRERVTAIELDVFHGRENWEDVLDVSETAPDFRIRQPRVPHSRTEAEETRMPDKITASDVNGDGNKDLVITSCDYEADGQEEGALFVYFGPYEEGGMLNLQKDDPDVAVYSSDDYDVCTAKLEKINGDAAADILVSGSTSLRQQDYHYGAIVYGRPTWEAVNDVSDIVGTRIVNNTEHGDVDVSVKDINGDGKKDVVGKAWVYNAPKWSEQVECVWFGGASMPDVLETGTCDFKFTDKWPMEFADINGDGALDYFFEMDHHGVEPYVWRIGLGPIEQGGEMDMGDSPTSGDYTLVLPYTTDAIGWECEDIGGTENDDLVLLQPDERFDVPDTGAIRLQMGPLVEVPIPPTHTPTPVPPPTKTPLPTATSVPPTATPVPHNDIYLPVCKNR